MHVRLSGGAGLCRHRLVQLFAQALLLILASLSHALAASATVNGTWHLMKDASGQGPKPGAVVALTFESGKLTFKATQPGETVTDRGQYTLSGKTITVEFAELDKGRQAGPYTVSADTLVLPFQMLGDDKGWSMWMRPAALTAFLGKVPARPGTPENMPALLARVQKVAEAFDNAKQRQAIDQRAKTNANAYRGGQAEAYYAQGAIFFMKGYYREAWYAFARAAVLQPTNAVYLHNLAAALAEIGSLTDARQILDWVTKNFPNLDPPWGLLGTTCVTLKDSACARKALMNAQALAPENGLYDHALGKLLEQEGKKDQARTLYKAAWNKGYAGAGNEGGRE